MNYPPYEVKDIAPVAEALEMKEATYQTYTWPVPEEVQWKGLILYVHGYKEGHTVYHRQFEYFAKHGYECFFYYQFAEGETKQLNEHIKVSSGDFYAYKALDDMMDYQMQRLKKSGKPLNIHLMGHSMGGGIVLNYAIEGKFIKQFKSVSVIAPLILLHRKTYPGFLTELIVRFLCLTNLGRNLRVPTPLKPHYLTQDPETAKYIEDRIGITNLTGAMGESKDFILRGRKLLDPSFYSQIDKQLPVLICHGDDDNINDCEASMKFIAGLNSIEGMQNKSLEVYKDGRHCLHAEVEPIAQKLADDLLQFLDKFNS